MSRVTIKKKRGNKNLDQLPKGFESGKTLDRRHFFFVCRVYTPNSRDEILNRAQTTPIKTSYLFRILFEKMLYNSMQFNIIQWDSKQVESIQCRINAIQCSFNTVSMRTQCTTMQSRVYKFNAYFGIKNQNLLRNN